LRCRNVVSLQDGGRGLLRDVPGIGPHVLGHGDAVCKALGQLQLLQVGCGGWCLLVGHGLGNVCHPLATLEGVLDLLVNLEAKKSSKFDSLEIEDRVDGPVILNSKTEG